MFSGITSSVPGMALAVIILTGMLSVLAAMLHPALFAVAAMMLISLAGIFTYRSRRTQTANATYPKVDRFFQQVPCYLSILNKDLEIIRTNELFRSDFGDRIGEKCHKVYKGSAEPCDDCPVLKTLADGQMHTTEQTVITKAGDLAKMIVYTTPVEDEQGNIVGVMEMATNITELKNLQKQIESGRREYRELFERVPCYISIMDKDFKILRVNELFKKELGAAIGRQCYEVYRKRDSVCPNCHVEQTLKDGKIHSGEKTVLKQDGTESRLIVYSSPIHDEQGNVQAVMEMATDITEVKRLQCELTYMGKTIAVMAHRIKNVLMGLEGSIFVINTGMEDGDEKLVKQGWEMIQRNSKNVSRMVKDLLYCSKEREMTFEQLDPTAVVQSVHELFEARAAQESIDLVMEIPYEMPTGWFDKEAIHSLLTNLVTNAIEACVNDTDDNKDGHRISLSARCDDNGNYVFEVEDNGQGIPGAVGECVFEDFFSTKGREGTGLGLLIAQKVMEEHGGTITFTSREGQGTRFSAVFPRAAEKRERV